SLNCCGDIFPAKCFSTSGRSVPDALLMTCRSFLSSPCTSEMTWMVPLGSVSTADSRAISASAASTLGKCSDSTRNADNSHSFSLRMQVDSLAIDISQAAGQKFKILADCGDDCDGTVGEGHIA